MNLCHPCTSVLVHKSNWLNNFEKDPNDLDDSEENYLFGHHSTGPSLQSAANNGCWLCQHLWAQLEEAERDVILDVTDADADDYVTYFLLSTSETVGLQDAPGSFLLCMTLGDKGDIKEKLKKVTNKETPAISMWIMLESESLQDFPFGYPSSDNTSSEESWATASRWLEECRSQHERCRPPVGDAPWYPTRLLDLGPNGEDLPTIKLVEPKKVEMSNSPYLTLSHCWGTSPFQTLTRESYTSFQIAISISSLPKTFQDAITIARRLSIQFLWIDSLCIIQNEPNLADWLYEASRMYEVYTYATLNISATSSNSASSGLFSSRDPSSLHTHSLSLCLNPSQWTHSQPSPPLTSYTPLDFQFWASSLSKAPLHTRGWVVQERLLAQRVLHFGSNQLLWECACLDACESFPSRLPPILLSGANTSFKSLDPHIDGRKLRCIGTRDANPAFFAHQLWPRIVEAYSNCLLTKPGDKVIAISGIARRLAAVIGDEYVVGMWRRYLASELLWSVDYCRQIDHSPSRRPEVYRAPSFSWASVDGCVNAASVADEGMLITVKDVCIEYATDDRWGLVKGGYLIVQGILKELQLRRIPETGTWRMVVEGREVKQAAGPLWEQLGPLVQLDVDVEDFEKENGEGRLFCLGARKPVGGYWTHFTCLLLEHLGRGEYRRVGQAMAKKEEEIEILDAPIGKGDRDGEGHPPCEEYDPANGMCTFRFV